MIRIDLWREPFSDTVDAMRRQPFAWGVNDCGPGLAAKIVKALTGQDLGADHVGKYHDEESARAYLESLGHDDLADYVATLLPEIDVTEATIGDIVAIPHPGFFKHALGVVNGERVFVMTARGIGTVDLLAADRAFKVG